MAADFTVGVEEEYQLVDPRTGALRSRARDVLRADWAEEISREVQQTMLEIGTRICANAGEVEQEIRRLRFQAATAAAAEDLRIVAAGLHPFSRWQAHTVSRGARYEALLERFGRILRTEHVFGMHVHVAVPQRLDRVHLLNRLRRYLPHLLALSCSSPFYEGEDTGFASYRAILFGRLPHSGIPPRLESERELHGYLDLLLGSGALLDEHSLYWNLRPHLRYPTLEFRVADVCPRAEDAIGLAALMRAMVVAAAEGALQEMQGPLSSAAVDEILRSDEWSVARFGLDAVLTDPEAASGRTPVGEGIERLIDTVAPIADALGDGAQLENARRILQRGNGARLIREMQPRCRDMPSLVLWLADESVLGTGLDRRGEQRVGCP